MKTQPLNIILIADNKTDHRLIHNFLDSADEQPFVVEWLTADQFVLAEIESKRHDVCFVDYRLEDQNGLNLLRQAMSRGCQSPWILLLECDEHHIGRQALEAGAADYLVKEQLSAALLRCTIRNAIRTKQTAQALRESEARFEEVIQQYKASYDQAIIYARELKEEITERKRMERVLEQRAAQLAIINEIGRKIAAVLDLDSMLERAVRLVQEAFNYHHVALFLLEEGEAKLKAIAGAHETHFLPNHTVKLNEGLIGSVGIHGERVVANDVGQEPRYTPSLPDHSIIRSELCLPIKMANRILGIFDIQCPNGDAFSENDVVALETLMDQIAVALANARLHEETQRRAKEWAALHEATRTMTSTLDLQTVMEKTMAETNTLLGSEQASVLLHDPVSDELYFAAVVAQESNPLLGQRLPLSAGIAGWAMREKQPVLVNDVRQDPRFYGGIDATVGITTRSILAVPMIYQDKAIGIVEVINKANGEFDQHDLEMLEVLTHSAAVAIENARLYDETHRRAKQLAVLHELDQAITTNLRITDVYRTFASHSARLLPYDHMSIILLENDNLDVTYVAGDSSVLPLDTKLSLDSSAAGQSITQGQPLLRHDIAKEPGFERDNQMIACGIQSALFIPLRIKGKFIGTWNLNSRQIDAYRADDLKIAQAMADQLAIAIENAWLFEEVQSGREQLQRLNRQIVTAQEEERQRLSRELHDEAGQALTALKIGLELVQAELPAGANGSAGDINEAIDLTNMTMEKLRTLARDLRPPALDTAGLNPTLEGLCRDFARRTKLWIGYTGIELTTLPDTANICLYRFLQEALTNVAKHAQASQVAVKLNYADDMVTLAVEDDGRGFNAQVRKSNTDKPKGIGLVGMQERLELLNGWLTIESKPGRGVRLEACIPFETN